MKNETKKTINKFGKTAHLLGIRKDGEKVYLKNASWNCDWYWGFGYLEVYNKRGNNINEHYNFDSLLKGGFGLDKIEKEFKSFVLEKKEIWELCDLMKTFYALKEVAEIYRGNSNYTTDSNLIFKNLELWKKTNKDIKMIADKIEEMLKSN